MASVFEVRDEVWEIVEPLLPEVPEQVGPGPPARARPHGVQHDRVRARDRYRLAPRPARAGVLGRDGVAAAQDWQKAGVWERLHATLLERLNAAGAIDWSAAVVDGSHIRALQGGSDRALAR